MSTSSPTFTRNGVEYYDELPPIPQERPNETVVPVWMIPAELRKQSWGWNPTWNGLENPDYGAYQHCAKIETDKDGKIVKVKHDLVRWHDGKIDPRTGLPTPGAVVAGIELVNGACYVHCDWQWRFSPYDNDAHPVPENLEGPAEIQRFIAAHTGMWMLTVPGGFAEFVGESAEAVAKREALEESALRLRDIKTTKKSFNRANVTTLVNVGFASFERLGDEIPPETHEKFFGQPLAVRIDAFHSMDAMVSEAINFAREELGLVSSGPRN